MGTTKNLPLSRESKSNFKLSKPPMGNKHSEPPQAASGSHEGRLVVTSTKDDVDEPVIDVPNPMEPIRPPAMVAEEQQQIRRPRNHLSRHHTTSSLPKSSQIFTVMMIPMPNSMPVRVNWRQRSARPTEEARQAVSLLTLLIPPDRVLQYHNLIYKSENIAYRSF